MDSETPNINDEPVTILGGGDVPDAKVIIVIPEEPMCKTLNKQDQFETDASEIVQETSLVQTSIPIIKHSPLPSISTATPIAPATMTTPTKAAKKSVLFDTVTVYHFTRSQGFLSIPSQGGSTLGMKRRHFLRRKLSVDLFEEVRRRSRREILLKIRYDKNRQEKSENCDQLHCNSVSSSASPTSGSKSTTSDSDDESFSEYSDISDSELETDSYIFCQPVGVKLRRSLLRASGVGRIDPKEKKECKIIRESRDRSGCNCVNQCIPGLCECSKLGVNCHVDRVSFPCGCISEGCRNPQGRTEFDIKRVKGHLFETLFKVGIG